MFSNNFRESNQEKKQRTDTINEAKKIKSDNFTRGNREKFNIAIAILEKWIIGWHHVIILYFGGTYNIFTDWYTNWGRTNIYCARSIWNVLALVYWKYVVVSCIGIISL